MGENDSVLHMTVACPVCAQEIGIIPVLKMMGMVMTMPTEAESMLLFMNVAMSHMVTHHTTGLTEIALGQLFTFLDENGKAGDFETWKSLFDVASK